MSGASPDILAELSQARREAADLRTQLRAAERQLTTRVSAEQFDSDTAPLRARHAELQRRVDLRAVADRYGLPVEIVGQLRGDDADQLDRAAALVVQHLPARR